LLERQEGVDLEAMEERVKIVIHGDLTLREASMPNYVPVSKKPVICAVCSWSVVYRGMLYCQNSRVLRPPMVDVVTGLKAYAGDAGEVYDVPWPLCEEINEDGTCEMYQESESKRVVRSALS
jgi:hypothetical protein